MITVHSFRRASFGAILVLGLMPLSTFAQQQSKLGQTENVPIFAENLTRSALKNIPHLDEAVAAEARMTPKPNSHMVIMGTKTDVLCPTGQFIELSPNLDIPGFKPITIRVIDGDRSQVYTVDSLPMLRIDPPTGGSNRKVVAVQAFDAQGNMRPVMQCTVREHIFNPNSASLEYEKGKEQCNFKIKDRQASKNTCLYLGNIYLGQVGEDADKIDIDERLLPPGKYSCQVAGKNEDGIYVPGMPSDFTVPNRYDIKCDNSDKEIVIGEHDDEKLTVTIKHKLGLSIKKTRVYIAGIQAKKEMEGNEFTIDLPTRDVPPGNCFIEVVGVAEDGVEYPVESLPIKIKNEPWMSRFTHSDDYNRMEEYDAKINQLWVEVRSNLVRAQYEKDIRIDTETFTLESIKKQYVVGDKAKYMAAAERAFVQMAHYQLQSARGCRTMKMRTKACSLYKNVVREVGLKSLDGIAAKEELDALRKPPVNPPS